MRTKNLTPFPLGTRVTSTRPPAPELVVIVRGRFRLVPNGVVTTVTRTLELPVEERAPMEAELALLGQGPLQAETYAEEDDARLGAPAYPGDFADFKPHGEAMLVGTAYASGGKPSPRCNVAFRVGAWEKRLVVFGARGWEEGLLGPEATEPVPFTQLKLGYERAFGGRDSRRNPVGIGLDGRLLPFVEYPDARIRSPGDRPKPAGFGPLAADWPFRKRKLGTMYGPEYAARAPFFAEDFDWRYFQSAPRDHWQEGFFRGDELVVLENLHREHARLETRLPGLKLRAFVNDVAGAFREVAMQLDTVFVVPDEDELLLTWRGRTPVLDRELDDVTALLVGSEPLGGPSCELDAWRDELLRFESDPLGLEALPPEMGRALRATTEAERAEATLAWLETVAPGTAHQLQTLVGHDPSGGDLAARIARGLEVANDAAPVVAPGGHLHAPLGLRDTLVEARERLATAAPDAAESWEATLKRLDLRRLDPTFRTPGELPREAHDFGPGSNLDGRDLSGLDLTGIDLRGASLRGAILKGTRLSGADLAGADLEGALLFRADLSGASLAGARLVGVNAAEARFDGATLRGASIANAFFGRCSCVGAGFEEAEGQSTHFANADLTLASFVGARLALADFEGATLDRTRFAGADLARPSFFRVRATELHFEGARLDGALFEGVNLADAAFVGAQGDGVNFTGATLSRADFRWARFPRAQFTKAVADGARFDAAELTGARFFKADVSDASFAKAKLVSVDLCRASLDRTQFDGAQVYDAKLLEARGRDTSFSGAHGIDSVRMK